MATAAPGLSVVIPTYSRAEQLDRCLHALLAQAVAPTEVIVVDDATPSGSTPAVLERWKDRPTSFRLHVERLLRNGGPARARNAGVKIATGTWVAFTDDDCEPEPGWVAALQCAASGAGAKVAGIGGRVLPATTGLVSEYMTMHRILEPPPSCSYLVTANCMYRRSVFESVGGFDERVRQPGGEDPGLSFMVTDAGHQLGFCPEAVVRHHYRESALDFLKTFYRYGRGVRLVVGR